MARKTVHDEHYRRAQSRLVRDAAARYQRPDWGAEDPKIRDEYDALLERTGTPVRKGGKK